MAMALRHAAGRRRHAPEDKLGRRAAVEFVFEHHNAAAGRFYIPDASYAISVYEPIP